MAGWDLVIAVSSGGRRIGYLVAVVVFCFWLHRMYKNLPPLGATAPRFTPGLAVGSYFIPLLNLVRGFQVMQALWMDSQPPPATAPVDVEPRRDPPLVYLWWGTFLAASFAGRLGGTGTATTLEEWVSASWFSTAILAGFGVSGALFIALVRGVARRQREQWDDLVRRRPVAPATDRLR